MPAKAILVSFLAAAAAAIVPAAWAGGITESFDFPSGAELWGPAEPYGNTSRTSHNWRVVGRLAPGTTLEVAREEVDARGRGEIAGMDRPAEGSERARRHTAGGNRVGRRIDRPPMIELERLIDGYDHLVAGHLNIGDRAQLVLGLERAASVAAPAASGSGSPRSPPRGRADRGAG